VNNDFGKYKYGMFVFNYFAPKLLVTYSTSFCIDRFYKFVMYFWNRKNRQLPNCKMRRLRVKTFKVLKY
jgi:hypothetical protein